MTDNRELLERAATPGPWVTKPEDAIDISQTLHCKCGLHNRASGKAIEQAMGKRWGTHLKYAAGTLKKAGDPTGKGSLLLLPFTTLGKAADFINVFALSGDK